MPFSSIEAATELSFSDEENISTSPQKRRASENDEDCYRFFSEKPAFDFDTERHYTFDPYNIFLDPTIPIGMTPNSEITPSPTPNIVSETINPLEASVTETQAQEKQAVSTYSSSNEDFCFNGFPINYVHKLSKNNTLQDLGKKLVIPELQKPINIGILYSYFTRYNLTYVKFYTLSSQDLKKHFAKYGIDTSQPLPKMPPNQIAVYHSLPFNVWHQHISTHTGSLSSCSRKFGYPYYTFATQLKYMAPSEEMKNNTTAIFDYFKKLSSDKLAGIMGKYYFYPVKKLMERRYFANPVTQDLLKKWDIDHQAASSSLPSCYASTLGIFQTSSLNTGAERTSISTSTQTKGF